MDSSDSSNQIMFYNERNRVFLNRYRLEMHGGYSWMFKDIVTNTVLFGDEIIKELSMFLIDNFSKENE